MNTFNFTIKVGLFVYIYYENLPDIFEDESENSISNVIGSGHHIPKKMNLPT